MSKLYDLAAEMSLEGIKTGDRDGEGNITVLDLYCGAGTIGLWLLEALRESDEETFERTRVIGIESVKPAVIDANRNSVINGFINTRYVCGRAEEELPRLIKKSATDVDGRIEDAGRNPSLSQRAAGRDAAGREAGEFAEPPGTEINNKVDDNGQDPGLCSRDTGTDSAGENAGEVAGRSPRTTDTDSIGEGDRRIPGKYPRATDVDGAVEDAGRNPGLSQRAADRDVAGREAGEFAEPPGTEIRIERADVAILDPPRAGCGEPLLAAVAMASPGRIVYVSCDPGTLARDVKYLCANGYKFVDCTVIDQFPWTMSIETVACLSRQ